MSKTVGFAIDNESELVDRLGGHTSWLVYLLRCRDGSLYCGMTNDLKRRLAAHARGQVKYTRGRLPVEVAYEELAADRGQALRREAALKRLRRAEKLRLIGSTA
jgi:putative endonuclease